MHWPRRLLLLAAVASIAAAAVLALWVIPPAHADTYPHATPERAVPALWVIVILNILVAAGAFGSSRLRSGNAIGRRVWTGVSGFFALLLGLALMDAATALASHGPAMRGAALALWVCVCLDVVGGVSMIASTFMRRTDSPGQT